MSDVQRRVFISYARADSTAFVDRLEGDLKELQHYSEALAACAQALRLDPQYAIAYEAKAFSLDALGRKQEAEQCRQKARELGDIG